MSFGRGGFAGNDNPSGGGFGSDGNDGSGGFRGGRGGGNNGFADNGGTRGGRGGFAGNDNSSGGGFGSDGNASSGGFRGGRGGGNGGFADNGGSRGGRGGFSGDNNSSSGGFGGDGNAGSGGFRGGRGGGNGGFADNGGSRGGRGGFSGDNNSSGGGFGSDGNAGSGGFRGGRGGGNNGFAGNGGTRGGRGGFVGNDNSSGGGFGGDENSSSGGYRGGRGRGSSGFADNGGSRGGGFGNDGGSGSFGGNRDNFGGNNDSGRGGFGGDGNSGFGGNRGGAGFGNDEGSRGGGFRGGRGGRGSGGNTEPLPEGTTSFGNFAGNMEGGNRPRRNFESNANGENEGHENGGNQGPLDADGNPLLVPTVPRGWVPKSRETEQLFSEDQNVGENYASVCDDDEEVVVEGLSEEIVKIERWTDAEFPEPLMENLKRCRYVRPRRIQTVALPLILDHYDVRAQAETGSGKTAAFVLPILDACIRAKGDNTFQSSLAAPFALIIGPTRELVVQVYEQAKKFAEGTGISIAKAYGQYPIGANHREIREGCDILCGTPGRLKHFFQQGDILAKHLKFLVLDEADQLLDESFKIDITDITTVSGFPGVDARQTLLFSATFEDDVMVFANEFLKPDSIFITNKKSDANKRIVQDFKVMTVDTQMDGLADMFKAELEKSAEKKLRRTLVFTNTKRKADMLALYLCNIGVKASSINGDRGQNLREEALAKFREGSVDVLVSTDVCARGIDIKGLDHVINLEAPSTYKNYIHRIGRTGRICQGYATTIVDSECDQLLPVISEAMKNAGKEVPESLTEILNKAATMAPTSYSNFAQTPGDAEPNADGPSAQKQDW